MSTVFDFTMVTDLQLAALTAPLEDLRERLAGVARADLSCLIFAVARRTLDDAPAACRLVLEFSGMPANIEESENGHTPLFFSARYGLPSVASVLVDMKADVNHCDKHMQSPIFYSARYGNYECLKLLLQRHASPCMVDVVGQTPLFYACEHANSHDAVMCEDLLRARCPPNHIDLNSQTALFFAAREGSTRKVQVLLDWRASPHMQDGAGQTPITFAKMNDQVDVCNLLLQHVNEANARTTDSRKFQRLSTKRAKREPVWDLHMTLSKRSDPDRPLKVQKRNPIEDRPEEDHPAEERPCDEQTHPHHVDLGPSLPLAAGGFRQQTVTLEVRYPQEKHQPEITSPAESEYPSFQRSESDDRDMWAPRTVSVPLRCASSRSTPVIVPTPAPRAPLRRPVLPKTKPSVVPELSLTWRLTTSSPQNQQSPMIQALPDLADETHFRSRALPAPSSARHCDNGRLPVAERSRLVDAIRHRSVEQVHNLVQSMGGLEGVPDDGLLSLAAGRCTGALSVCRCLVEGGLDPSCMTQSKQSPLFDAALVGNADVCEYLGKFCNADALDGSGRTALFIAASAGHTDVVASLLSSSSSPNIRDKDGKSPLIFAVKEGVNDVVRVLVRGRANVGAEDDERRTALWHAICQSRVGTAHLLLNEFGASFPLRREGEELIEMARDRGLDDVVESLKRLMQSKKAIPKTDPEHAAHLRDSLLNVARGGTCHQLDELLRSGADAKQTDKDGASALHFAAARSDVEGRLICERLLRAGACPRALDGQRQTPLFAACRTGTEECVAHLLKAECNPGAQDASGETALFEAVRHNRVGISVLLVEKGARADHWSASWQTPLFCALRPGCMALLSFLYASGARVQHTDREGRTALFYAKDAECAQFLIANSCEVHIQDTRRRTAVFSAAERQCEALLRVLIERGARVDISDEMGKTPLHHTPGAACTTLLLEARAQVDVRDANEQTALFYACRLGDAERIRELVAQGANANSSDAKQQTPLFLAARHASLDVVRMLVEKVWADPAVQDKEGRTAVQMATDEAVINFLSQCVKIASQSVGTRRHFYLSFDDPSDPTGLAKIPFGSPAYEAAMQTLAKSCPWLCLDHFPRGADAKAPMAATGRRAGRGKLSVSS